MLDPIAKMSRATEPKKIRLKIETTLLKTTFGVGSHGSSMDQTLYGVPNRPMPKRSDLHFPGKGRIHPKSPTFQALSSVSPLPVSLE